MRALKISLVGGVLLLPFPTGAWEFAPMALNSFSTAPKDIRFAKVFDQGGHLWGAVRGIATDEVGRPAAISVMPVDGQPLFVIAAAAVSYDEPRNIVIAEDGAKRIAEAPRFPRS